MHILLKNKKIIFNNYRLKCSIGKRGITSCKSEGDKKTPRGVFKFKSVFFRKDRIKNLKTKLSLNPIKRNMGWCDDKNSKFYNKLIKYPFYESSEKLYRRESIYDIIVVIDFNMTPIKKGKGSAIFIHLASKNYKPTLGCIALKKQDLILLLNKISKNDKIKLI